MSNNEIGSDPKGLSFIVQGYRNTMPADQYLREVNKNAEEAVQRVQKINPEYQGKITFRRDENYFRRNKVSKLCIIDNGDGMNFDFLKDYMMKLGASLRGNRHKNWGAGFKITALPFNPFGIVISSWTEESESGFMVWAHFNQQKMVYELKRFGPNVVVQLDPSEKPPEIDKHGTKITFLGDDPEHNTMKINPLLRKGGLFKGGRTGDANWIPSYLNTKKYEMEKNILTKCYDEESNTSNTRIIKGHRENLLRSSNSSGSVQLTKAKVDWFILPGGTAKGRHTKNSMNTYALTVGQLAVAHEDEVLKVDYAGRSDRNPLSAWGHQYSRLRVALVLRPDENEFRPNLERTEIYRDNLPCQDYFNNWKEEWQSKTPKELVDLEKEMAEKAMEKSSNYEDELKKISSLFRADQYVLSSEGEFDIEKDKALKTGGNKDRLGKDKSESDSDSGPNPDKDYGEIEQILGIKVARSQNKGVLATNNPYPMVGFVERDEMDSIAEYHHSTYSVEINTNSLQISQLVDHRAKKDKINNYAVVKQMLLEIVSFQIKQQVAHVVNISGYEEEAVLRALSSESLSACLANKSMLLDKLDERLKSANHMLQNIAKEKQVNLFANDLE